MSASKNPNPSPIQSYHDKINNSLIYGANAPFIEGLYEEYLENPNSITEGWRQYFDKLVQQPGFVGRDVPHSKVINAFAMDGQNGLFRQRNRDSTVDNTKQVKVLQLITAYRFIGNRWARLDPLNRNERPVIPELELSYYGFSESDLTSTFNVGSLNIDYHSTESATLAEIWEALKATYCSSIGAEYMYLGSKDEKRWIQSRLEPIRSQQKFSDVERKDFLRHITAAETLERYLHTKYVGQKRFSLEGGESLILSMAEIIKGAGTLGTEEIIIGMAHRGRLNVLINILGKSPSLLFDEFEGKKASNLSSGDVKYHLGYASDVNTPGGPVHLSLAFNPSHLEIINPVVEGSVYARQMRRGENGKDKVLPILIHGDAAVIGQGVNQETLNFAQTRGYGTGGTVHIIVNNQIGFTTSDPRDYRSSIYCTDIFKMTEAPIFHVNGDDPEAVALVSQLAIEYRQKFKKDVVVDIVCYRKLGHNEQDEPMVTQPLMYKKINAHHGTRKKYGEQLVAQGVLKNDEPERFVEEYREHLDLGKLLNNPAITNHQNRIAQNWEEFVGRAYTEKANTALPKTVLERLSGAITKIPDNFTLHPRVKKIMEDRKLMSEDKLPIDWGMAENLAYATLLVNGYGVRISGEDVARGTFFHRHAALHDQNRERWDAGAYYPLKNVNQQQAQFYCYDSVLSEEGVLAFEYGYATAEPNWLIVWEAQFGDFANGAQVVIDQFIASGEAKWGRACGLVMLLPHGYEGQGPEHSSARLERYLQLSADFNWEVCVPTTASQIYHLIRRQMLRKQRKPLIVMTPKSLLRNPLATSSLDDLANGTFETIIADKEITEPKKVKRVVVCSGKVFFDLQTERKLKNINDIAILRVEQLYPFDDYYFQKILDEFNSFTELVWCQEEPLNQGAWYAKAHRLNAALKKGQTLHVVSRPASSSPAVGYLAKHNLQQKEIVEEALGTLNINPKEN